MQCTCCFGVAHLLQPSDVAHAVRGRQVAALLLPSQKFPAQFGTFLRRQRPMYAQGAAVAAHGAAAAGGSSR